jgi:hypothetical protein
MTIVDRNNQTRQRIEQATVVDIAGVTPSFVRSVQSQQQQTPVFNPNASVDWIKYNSGLGYLPLAIDIPWVLLQQEAHAVVHHMHRLDLGGKDSHGWSTLPIYLQGEWTGLMPKTVEWFKTQWPCKHFYTIRLLGLDPDGVIGLHTDDCRGLNNINIAIDHPPECKFVLERSGVIPFVNGAVFAVDTGLRHAVVNPGSQLRLHIAVYHEDNEQYQQVLFNSYEKYCTSS